MAIRGWPHRLALVVEARKDKLCFSSPPRVKEVPDAERGSNALLKDIWDEAAHALPCEVLAHNGRPEGPSRRIEDVHRWAAVEAARRSEVSELRERGELGHERRTVGAARLERPMPRWYEERVAGRGG